ncbi:MAG: DNA polymerase III subunit delta [Bacteroidetes bacterium 4572_77]|nr:MAG: DNA polymerase III subunit delta [Bacteroidetes bacterium 4572_77]
MAKLEYEQIMQDLQNKIYHPVYVLAGEEPYFIDSITNFMEENVLDAMEREFNQTIVYGLDTNGGNLIGLSRSYPMSANYQVVIVKEAQHLKGLADLELYLNQPLDSTILVLAYKGKKLDKRTKFYKLLTKKGVYYESKKLYDNNIPQWIEGQIKKQGYRINVQECVLLAEYLGTDLSKITNEIKKLVITLKKGDLITPDVIEQNIGISKDYNIFALTDALAAKDILRTNKIIQYFIGDEKNHSIHGLIPVMHSFFYRSLVYFQLKDKSKNSVASHLGVSPFTVPRYVQCAQNYPPMKLAAIIGYLQKADMNAKGVGATNALTNSEILREMIYKILH